MNPIRRLNRLRLNRFRMRDLRMREPFSGLSHLAGGVLAAMGLLALLAAAVAGS